MDKKDIALELFRTSHNCSQAVFTACADKSRIDAVTAKSVAAGFGGGIGRTQATCGAVTGAIMAIGVSQFDPADIVESKRHIGDLTRAFMNEFELREGSVSCRLLLGVDLNTPEGVEEARSKALFSTKCETYVTAACDLLEEIL